MKKGKAGERFKRLYIEVDLLDGARTRDVIVKDLQTGVLYYQAINSRSIAMIPLLDSNGKPIIEPVEE